VRIAYFDCFAGASGNMILGALVDAGLPLGALERELAKLPVSGWAISAGPVRKRGLGALYLDVRVPGEDHDHRHVGSADGGAKEHAHRRLADVLEILKAAAYPREVEQTATAIYRRLAEAEARVHRVPVDEILFHEVGQVDAIVDITGAALGLHLLGIERVYCSPLPCGRGTIHSAHGDLPTPPPATLELLRGSPTYAIDFEGELVTPTGAAILTSVAAFDVRPPMTIERIGYGSGRSDFPFANVLRVIVGEAAADLAEPAQAGPDTVVQLETNIDDMNPQLFEHVVDQMYAAGALDVWLQPAHMKKNRLGTIVSALAPHERADLVAEVLLAQTTTLGVRRWTVQRVTLPRRIASVTTSFGPVRVKIVTAPNGVRARPEYEDCKAIAHARGIALAEVMRAVEADIAQWLLSQST
jgi:pyridinium-3,5-bisthiocarboxylic acid mononucleotide nickel chelatase